MINKILTVCVGNICRSPMAEGLMIKMVSESGRDTVISSAGLHAMTGRPADNLSIELLKSMDIDITAHRARQLSENLLQEVDLVLVMENWQKEAVLAISPLSRGKVYQLGHWTGLEIEDPYKKPRVVYAQVLGKIKKSVDSWKDKL